MRRCLTIVLAILLILSAMPITAMAADGDPIEIRTIEDLYLINNNMSGNYILMNDIDMTEATAAGGDWDFDGRGWDPIGSNGIYTDTSPFTGTFDGNGHNIKGMRIDIKAFPSGSRSNAFVGLFASNKGTIKNLTVSGSILINCDKHQWVGGIAGANFGTITACGNYVDISCKSTGYYYVDRYQYSYYIFVGGIAGGPRSDAQNAIISDCYNEGDISSTGSSGSNYSSGIASIGSITNCYNAGTITAKKNYGSDDANSDVITVYGSVKNCYYLNNSGNSTWEEKALTAAQMKLKSAFIGFDFENTWAVNARAEYQYPQCKNNFSGLKDYIKGIAISSPPKKTRYYVGDKLSLKGFKIKSIYNDDSFDELAVTKDMVTVDEFTAPGEYTAKVSYKGYECEQAVTVVDKPELLSLVLLSEPNKKEFAVNTQFDFTGAKARATYSNGDVEDIDLDPEDVTGGNIDVLGDQTIKFTLDGVTVSFNVKVVPVAIESLEVESLPYKTEYIEGQTLDSRGLKVRAYYNNGTDALITNYELSELTSDVGKQNITVTSGDVETSFEVNVKAKKAVSISVTTNPDKTTYVVGESFDRTGMKVYATYNDGDQRYVEDYSVSEPDDNLGTQSLTVTYQEVTTQVSVYVVAKNIESLEITPPDKDSVHRGRGVQDRRTFRHRGL